MVKRRGKQRRARKQVSETTTESASMATGEDNSGSTGHEPLTNIRPRVYETRGRKSLLTQCTLRSPQSLRSPRKSLLTRCTLRSPQSLRSPIRNVNGIASRSFTLALPENDLFETTPASQNFNLGVPPEPQVGISAAIISRSPNKVESSKSTNLVPTSADYEEFDKNTTNALDMLQESSSPIPPSTTPHEVALAPELLSLPTANRESRINEHQSEGSCINGNGHNKCLAPSPSFNYTEFAEMLDDSADEVDSAVDPALVNVEGYKVKKEVARLLGLIILKHGDIAKDSSLKSVTSRSMYLGMMCDIYLSLEKEKLKDLDIKDILAKIADLEGANLKVGWLRKRVEDIAEALEECKKYKDWKDMGARKSVKEEMLVKQLEKSRKTILEKKNEAEESRKKIRLLEELIRESQLEVEELIRESQLTETQVAETQAQKKECEEAKTNSRAKMEFLKRPLVDGLL